MAFRRRSGDGADYPSLTASRLRLRRMICFLRYHGLTNAARELETGTGVFFDAAYMEHLMRIGSWDKADGYLMHFLTGPSDKWSPQCFRLVMYLRSAWTLAAVAAGGPHAADFASTFDEDYMSECPRVVRFRSLLHAMHADQTRASMLWKNVAPDAVNRAMDLVAECPELKGKLHLPRDKPMPWEVAPLIGARTSQRRRGNGAGRKPTSVIIHAYKRQKRLLPIQETVADPGFPGETSSSPVVLNTRTEQIGQTPIILGGVLSDASSSSVALNTKHCQMIEPSILEEQPLEAGAGERQD